MPTDIAARLAAVRARIAAACARAGRPAGDVHLIAVSKTHDASAVLAAVAAGQTRFGENRVQEAARKFREVAASAAGTELHLIGGLQSNKADQAVRIAAVIESLDRPGLADAIDAAAQKHGRLPRLLVQVNTGDEAQKSGVALGEAGRFIAACQARFADRLQGLMCIPPVAADPLPHFRLLAALARAHGLAVLSMGMSGDFEQAIAAGATQVRVGSAIFGARPAA